MNAIENGDPFLLLTKFARPDIASPSFLITVSPATFASSIEDNLVQARNHQFYEPSNKRKGDNR